MTRRGIFRIEMNGSTDEPSPRALLALARAIAAGTAPKLFEEVLSVEDHKGCLMVRWRVPAPDENSMLILEDSWGMECECLVEHHFPDGSSKRVYFHTEREVSEI